MLGVEESIFAYVTYTCIIMYFGPDNVYPQCMVTVRRWLLDARQDEMHLIVRRLYCVSLAGRSSHGRS